jgi:hypothetical protein
MCLCGLDMIEPDFFYELSVILRSMILCFRSCSEETVRGTSLLCAAGSRRADNGDVALLQTGFDYIDYGVRKLANAGPYVCQWCLYGFEY